MNQKALGRIIVAVILVAVLAVSAVVVYYFAMPTPPTQQSSNPPEQTGDFDNPKKSAHYESNTPAHGSVLAAVPLNVVIDFNFDLAPPSKIEIQRDGVDYGVGETVIDENKLAMRRTMSQDAPDGLYTVIYDACWPDGSCHDGNFQFRIDRSQISNFTDRRGQTQVTIEIVDFAFEPQQLLISQGTNVTWINRGEEEHYINTDSHPAHTYFPPQNSMALARDETFSLTFNSSGIYPYHCSAHAAIMNGTILVD